MTVSIWRRTMALGTIECDVAIVGAGICGLSAAMALERRGLRVVVLERHAVGSGASSRNAGYLMRGAADNYAAAIEQYGHETARELWRISEQNLEMLLEIGLANLPSFRRVPSCLLGLTEKEQGELARSLELMREDGFAVEWIGQGGRTPPEDAVWRAGGMCGPGTVGLLNPGDACCNPWELLGLLRSRVQGRLLEGQEVVALESRGSKVEARVTDGVVMAERVLLATNAYAGLLVPELAKVVTPRRGQMLACRVDGARLAFNYYANHGSEYFREGPDGTLIFGGCRTYHAEREVGYEDRPTPWVQDSIEAFARKVLGIAENGALNVTARWTGTMGFSPDGLPLVSAVGSDRRVWFCGGFTGHGMSLAHATAALAVEEMLGGRASPFPLARVMRCPGA